MMAQDSPPNRKIAELAGGVQPHQIDEVNVRGGRPCAEPISQCGQIAFHAFRYHAHAAIRTVDHPPGEM